METFTDDTVVALASFLSPCDMLSLALSCKRFGHKHGTTTSRSRRLAEREARKSGGSGREVRQKTESISLMEVAARTVLQNKCTDEEKNALPRQGDESWISIYQEFLKLFRFPLQFDKLVGVNNIEYVEGSDKTRAYSKATGNHGSAICSNIMRAGMHSVSFQVIGDPTKYGIQCGVMRPTTKDITSLTECYAAAQDLSSFSLKVYEMFSNNVDCCMLSTSTGKGLLRKRWKNQEDGSLSFCQPYDWDGMEEIHDTSFKIGMVLDLDVGTLDVYKNDRRLGTMATGLAGEYCWVVSMARDGSDVSATIGR